MSAPTRAALKAAEGLRALFNGDLSKGKSLEEIIDRETGLPGLIEALKPFVKFAQTRIEIFGENSFQSWLEPVINNGKLTAQLTRQDWERAIAALQQAGVEQKASAE